MIGKGPQIPTSVTQITEQQQIEVAQSQLALPRIYVAKSKAQATPSVKNILRLIFNNVAPLDVTNFLQGQEGQEIIVLGDGQTTIKNNANILTNTAADKLLLADYIYKFVLFNSKWYEDT
jgi:hypothetical protein